MATDSNVLEVRIQNSENNTAYFLYVRRDRLEAFYNFLNANRCPETPKGMPGLSWAAMMGLDAIFEKRPRKFPVYDIINFLANDVHSTPAVTAPEIERTLERFGTVYPPDVAESA
jgi:hypothetical protein